MTHKQEQPNQLAPPHWESASFLRDTLIYNLGALADTLMRAAFKDRTVALTYKQLRAQIDRGDQPNGMGELLLHTGLNKGHVRLFVRPRPEEFYIQYYHPDFKGLTAIGYDVSNDNLLGIFVVDFDGPMGAGIHFSKALAAEINLRYLIQAPSYISTH